MNLRVKMRSLSLETFRSSVKSVLRQINPNEVLSGVVKKLGFRDLVQSVTKLQRLPDDEEPDNPKLLLLLKILETWIHQSQSPVLLVLIPTWAYTEGSSDSNSCQARFHELVPHPGNGVS